MPTDTRRATMPRAERTAELLRAFGMQAEAHPCPAGSTGLRPAIDHQPDRAARVRPWPPRGPERPRRLRRPDRDGNHGAPPPTRRHTKMTDYSKLDAWVDAHFDEEVRSPAGAGARAHRHPAGQQCPARRAHRRAAAAFGMQAEAHPVPEQEVRDYGLQSITNLIVRREYGPGRRVALNAHGDVVPPGEGWRHDPYGAQIEDGYWARRRQQERLRQLHLRRARWRPWPRPAMARSSCISPTTRNSAACWDRAGCRTDQARPADRGRLQLRRGVGAQRLPADGSHRARRNGARGRAETGVDALQGAVRILNALYAQNARYREVRSQVPGIITTPT